MSIKIKQIIAPLLIIFFNDFIKVIISKSIGIVRMAETHNHIDFGSYRNEKEIQYDI